MRRAISDAGRPVVAAMASNVAPSGVLGTASAILKRMMMWRLVLSLNCYLELVLGRAMASER